MSEIQELLAVMAKLRDPDGGCPWDLEQDFHTIAPYTLEEAYEVADAIVREDMDELREELGDLLLQVVFHSRMAQELGHFEFKDVVAAIVDKMVRRHPHVFATKTYANVEEQKQDWDRIKAEENAKKKHRAEHRFEDIAVSLPPLQRAEKITKKAAKIGFDWPTAHQVLDKLEEEVAEIKEAMASGDEDHVREEMGDLLFVCANLARKLGVDSDRSLREANQKFIRRFITMEKLAETKGEVFEALPLDQQEAYWQLAKQALKKDG